MATQEVRQGTEPVRAWAFLAEHGIAPDAAGAYPEDAILDAVRARGWEVKVTGQEGDWYADVGEERGPDPSDDVWLLASDRDRQTALLRALDAALLWLDRDAAREAFDREAKERLGISGEEFLRRWQTNGFDPETYDLEWGAVSRLITLAPLAS